MGGDEEIGWIRWGRWDFGWGEEKGWFVEVEEGWVWGGVVVLGVDVGGGEEVMILEWRGICYEKEIRDVLGGGKEFGVGKVCIVLVFILFFNCIIYVYNYCIW